MPEVILFFPEKEKRKGLGLQYLDSPWPKFFLENIFFDSCHILGEIGGQSWTESANFGPVLFLLKLRFCKDSGNTFFRCLNSSSGENLSKIGPYLGE